MRRTTRLINEFSYFFSLICLIVCFFFMLALISFDQKIKPYPILSVLCSLCTINQTGQTPHQCDVCGKKYTRKEHLANHMRSHTNETPFRCEICGKSFSRKEHFTNHILWHTGKETKQNPIVDEPNSRTEITRRCTAKTH